MASFEVLCATMRQTDFSKIKSMNIRTDVVFANQADRLAYEEYEFDGNLARMITTNLRGVGKNRNISLMFAKAEICLLADDDMVYVDDYEQIVLKAFEELPTADIIIFNIVPVSHINKRKPAEITSVKRIRKWNRNPFGGPRIAFRTNSIKKANLWFTILFGGGCTYPSGEDSMWLSDARRSNLKIYAYPECIGSTDYSDSSWFEGYGQKYFFGKGAYYKVYHSRFMLLWALYFALRTTKKAEIGLLKRIACLIDGMKAVELNMSYEEWRAAKYE